MLVLVLIGYMVIFAFNVNTVSAASGDNIYVNTSGNDNWDGLNPTFIGGTTGPKATIKNATKTVNTNGTVYILQGIYKENNIIIQTNMTIIGESQQNTIINGNNGPIFNIPSDVNFTIYNITLTNGNTNDDGGAIYNNGELKIINSILSFNSAKSGSGGAIYNNGKLTVLDTAFEGNIASSGSAITNYGSFLTINNCSFKNNNATYYCAGAIFNCPNTDNMVNISNSTFTGNTANANAQYGIGGAIENLVNLSISNCTFTENKASDGGAIGNYYNLYVNSCTFTDNTAIYGGAIYGRGTSIVHFSRFVGNTAKSGNAVYGNGNFDARLNWWGSSIRSIKRRILYSGNPMAGFRGYC